MTDYSKLDNPIQLATLSAAKWSALVFTLPSTYSAIDIVRILPDTTTFEMLKYTLGLILASTFIGGFIGAYVGFVLSFVTRKYFPNPEHNENLYRGVMIGTGMIVSLLPSIFFGSAATWEITKNRPLFYEVLVVVVIGYLIAMARVSYVSASYHLEYQRNNLKKATKSE